ncbi:MAG: hypothetical protein V3V08_13200 [Nannocystaceae bacterium]
MRDRSKHPIAAACGLLWFSSSGACFDATATLGLPCRHDESCAPEQHCVAEVCSDSRAAPPDSVSALCELTDGGVALSEHEHGAAGQFAEDSRISGSCRSAGREAAFTWTAPVSGEYFWSLLYGASLFLENPPFASDTSVSVYENICGESEHWCGRVADDRIFEADGGAEYTVVLDGLLPDFGSGEVEPRLSLMPTSICEQYALKVPATTEGFRGLIESKSSRFLEVGNCPSGGLEGTDHLGFGHEAIFEWSPPGNGVYEIVASSVAVDTVLYVLDDGCGSLARVCNDDFSDLDGSSKIQVDVTTEDETLVIVVDTYEIGFGKYELSIKKV